MNKYEVYSEIPKGRDRFVNPAIDEGMALK
jgi:hypothetical protein